MTARHPLHDAWLHDQADAAAQPRVHRWRVSHVDADGTRRMQELRAASSWTAMAWMEQLYGLPRACAAIRLSPLAAPATEGAAPHG